MEFIFSPFLWFLPLSAAPLIFHLINSRKFKTVEFSSIYFINSLKSKAIRKMNIVNILLLIVRMLIIACLIFSISRPVMSGVNAQSVGDSSLILTIIVDDTFSNINDKNETSKIKEIKKGISAIIKNYKEGKKNTHLEILTIDKDLIFDGPIKDFQSSSLSKLKASYKAGDLSNIFVEYFNGRYSEMFLNGDMYIFSDMQHSSVDVPLDNEWWKINFIDTSSEVEPPLISNLKVEEMALSNQEVKIEMEIWNNNNFELFDITPNLLFDENINSLPPISIPKNSKRIISFNLDAKEQKTFEIIGYLTSLGNPKEAIGNKYFSTINTLPVEEVCFYDLKDSVLREHLNIAISAANPNAVIKTDCAKYMKPFKPGIVILDNFAFLDKENLIRYVKDGGHVIVFPSSLEDSKQIYLNILEFDLFFNQGVVNIKKENILNYEIFKNIFKNMNDDFLFSINKKYLLPLTAETVIEVPGKGSLWNRLSLEKGIIDLFGIPLLKGKDNYSTFAMRPALFPSTMIYFLNSNNNIEEIFLEEVSLRLKNINLDNFKVFYTDKINSEAKEVREIDAPGFYTIYSNDGDINKKIVSNVSLSEIRREKIDKKTLDERYGANLSTANISSLDKLFNKSTEPSEIWHLFLALSMLLIIAETIIINVIGKK